MSNAYVTCERTFDAAAGVRHLADQLRRLAAGAPAGSWLTSLAETGDALAVEAATAAQTLELCLAAISASDAGPAPAEGAGGAQLARACRTVLMTARDASAQRARLTYSRCADYAARVEEHVGNHLGAGRAVGGATFARHARLLRPRSGAYAYLADPGL
ncbi:MAG: hypothetical protein WBQ18_14470 [Solirubrobacteraceae bacterium]